MLLDGFSCTSSVFQCRLAYIDNILIYSPFLETHVQHIKQDLSHLLANQLYIKAVKKQASTISFLGYIIGLEGVSMDQAKVAVTEGPAPTTDKKFKTFLGIVSIYSKFRTGFSFIAAPLISILKKSGML